MRFPESLKYTKEHEWAKIEGNQATVGVTDHAQNALGDIVFVELPAVGKILKQGETFGVVESIKAVSDLYAPLSGKVIKTNATVISEPGLLNKDPHQSGWLIVIELSDPSAIQGLMDSSQYLKYVETLK